MIETIQTIDEQIATALAAAQDEMARLQRVREILAGSANGDRPARSPRRKRAARRPKVAEAAEPGAKLTARQARALKLIDAKPGITAAELSHAMGGTYGYAVVKRLRDVGQIAPCEKGWQRAG